MGGEGTSICKPSSNKDKLKIKKNAFAVHGISYVYFLLSATGLLKSQSINLLFKINNFVLLNIIF